MFPEFNFKTQKILNPKPEELITEEKIREKLQNLDTNKAIGPDDVHGKVLKNLANILAIPLAIIFRKSFKSGDLPSAWKKAHNASS